MKNLIYIILLVLALGIEIKAQSGVINPSNLAPPYVCKNRVVSEYNDLKNVRIRIIDSCSGFKSSSTYFIMDSIAPKKRHSQWKLDTIVFSSIRLGDIAEQLKSDTLLRDNKYFANMLTKAQLKLYFKDRNTGFIFGDHFFNKINYYFLFGTQDGGKHWTYKSILPKIDAQWPYFYWGEGSIYLFDKQKGIIVFKPGSGERFNGSLIIYSYTKDGGKTWINEKIKTGHSLIDVLPSYSESGQVTLVVKYRLISEDGDDSIETEVYQSKNFGEKFKKLK